MPTHTIAENLTRLQNAKTAIAGAITTAGGTVNSGDGLEDFATDIATIPTGNSNTVYNSSSYNIWNQWIETLAVPEGVTSIENSTLSNYPENLTTLKIPSTVTYIQDWSLGIFNNLTTIIVDQAENAIANAPWGADNATVIWTG